MDTLPSNAFVEQVQEALRHLYSPVELRQSALVPLLGLERRHNPALALQELLIGAIEELHPPDHVPPQADSWRIYHVLSYRHVEQSSQPAVAAILALSVRQLRRLERMSEQALAGHLWKRYRLSESNQELKAGAAQRTESDDAVEETPDLDSELAWLRESLPHERGNMVTLIRGLVETVDPLIHEREIQFFSEIDEDTPEVFGQLTALRQGLLNLITAAIHAAPSGTIHLWLTHNRSGIRVSVLAVGEAQMHWAMNSRAIDHLQMARRFISLFGGSLETEPQRGNFSGFRATVCLPMTKLPSVLVVDDNEDTLRLMERYLTGSRYRYYGARNPEEALSLAERVAPRAVVMDVMLPGIDDWELLGRLRAHPDLCAVPIIVCTILPQEELALALGAAAYLRKPVSRHALLDALDLQVSPQSRALG